MAFHIACPITCLKICYCALGFTGRARSSQGRKAFLEDVDRLQNLLKNPALLAANGHETTEIVVPRVSRSPSCYFDGKNDFAKEGAVDEGDDNEKLYSHGKFGSLRKKAARASLAAEEYARKLELGDSTAFSVAADSDLQQGKQKSIQLANEEASKMNGKEEEKLSNLQGHVCRLCFTKEYEGTTKAERMLSCTSCNKKYHRNCLKRWARNRDLFNWASWICPSCINCEVCRSVGDPNKLMFCKRCDAPYHSYCQQPPLKNVPPGPYLCPRHTWCHSCGSTVPGSGMSTRWFVGYTSCDACGRLFTKGKYCPICLKVYRDSESTPMVCCDVCQGWVHCGCDGISEEKYQQFQTDGNLSYKCGACRGDCYKVKDLDSGVKELWRRRDELEKEDMAKLRFAAGLPSQEEMQHFCPSSDDDDESLLIDSKDGISRKIKLVSKGASEKAVKNGKEKKHKDHAKKGSKSMGSAKKHVKKKDSQDQFNGSLLQRLQPEINADQDLYGSDDRNSKGNGSLRGSYLVSNALHQKPFTSEDRFLTSDADYQRSKQSFQGRVPIDNKIIKDQDCNSSVKVNNSMDVEESETEKPINKPEIKKPKLVFYLKNKDTVNPTNNGALLPSNSHRDEGSASSQGTLRNVYDRKRHWHTSEDANSAGNKVRMRYPGKISGLEFGGKLKHLEREKELQKDFNESEKFHQRNASPTASVAQSNRGIIFDTTSAAEDGGGSLMPSKKLKLVNTGRQVDNKEKGVDVHQSSPRQVPLILKLKRSSFENPPWTQGNEDDEGNVTKGQRSKRKRPHTSDFEEENSDCILNHSDGSKISDCNWILMKLGQEAVGKVVDVNKPADDSWHKGTVIGIREQSTDLVIRFDSGRQEVVELNKQKVRFSSITKPQSKRSRS